jgi:hypothetical protein
MVALHVERRDHAVGEQARLAAALDDLAERRVLVAHQPPQVRADLVGQHLGLGAGGSLRELVGPRVTTAEPERIALLDLSQLEPLDPLEHEAEASPVAGAGDLLDARIGADRVHVGEHRLLDVGVALDDHADHVAGLQALDQRDRALAPDGDAEGGAGQEHAAAQGEQGEGVGTL